MPATTVGGLAQAALLIAGLAASLCGSGCYLRDVLNGTTVPHRGAWTTWSAIAVVAASAHGASGGRASLVVLCAQAATTLTVWAASWRLGVGGIDRSNGCLLAVTVAGLVGWLTLSDPLAATACAVLADGSGLVAIVPKAWRTPHSETSSTYLLAAFSGGTALVAAHGLDAAGTLFPAYYLLGNLSLGLLICARAAAVRRERQSQPGAPSSRT